MSEIRWRRWVRAGIAACCIFVAILCSGFILFRNAARESRQRWLREKIEAGDIPPEEIEAYLEGEAFLPSEVESLKSEAMRRNGVPARPSK